MEKIRKARACAAWLLLGGLMWPAAQAGARAQAVAAAPVLATTSVTDTVYAANGQPASGTVLISWPAFVTAGGSNVPAGSTAVTLGANGALAVPLVPNAGSTPMGSYYTVVYHLSDGSTTRQYWVVPVTPAGGSGVVTVAAISTSVLPTSVAIQTVSKAYVDNAIAAATTGHPLDSSPYVVKTGDTMTGPLVLPADPVAANQAADKQYVDEQVTGLAAGAGQKVALNPQMTQVVEQPVGSDLEVNRLNGTEYASQYATGAGNNGIANAAATTDCAGGCHVVVESTYASNEAVTAGELPGRSSVEDLRNGGVALTSVDPLNPIQAGSEDAASIALTSTQSAAGIYAATGAQEQFSRNLVLTNNALDGGNNEFPQNVQTTTPYFKSTYTALAQTGNNNTEGQHVLSSSTQNCYGVGDCLMGGLFMTTSGGFRDAADEGAHPFDQEFNEDTQTFAGTCGAGCTSGATSLMVTPTAGAGTQGQGRYLLDRNPAKVISTGLLTGSATSGLLARATFSGTSFPVSVFLQTAQAVPTQANKTQPGTVTVALTGAGAPAGFASSTAALPAAAGVACVADPANASVGLDDFETANYTVIDATHLQMTLYRPHVIGATIAVGGLCGYGAEQTVDTKAGIRQVFPVIGSDTAASLYYAGGKGPILGASNTTSGYVNLGLVVASIARAGNVVTLTTSNIFPFDVNGLTLTVQGVADASYNGSFMVKTTANNTLTYTAAGPDSSSTGGTVTYLTGGYALYPMAEARSVFNPATKAVDGLMTLAPNTVNWAQGDAVEQPHYFMQRVAPDIQFFSQTMPRPSLLQQAGLSYGGENGPGLIGWQISNTTAASEYFGLGGTHNPPLYAMQVTGAWQASLDVVAGQGAALAVHCNLHGCGSWNSAYNLLQMDAANGTDAVNYAPPTSTLRFGLAGSEYIFSPQALTANTINVTNLNAGSIKGLFTGQVAASALPVFGASGVAHQVGAVPDPGTAAGTTRFLREDGSWAVAGGAAMVSSASGYQAVAPAGMPERTALLGEYLLTEGSGTVAHDTSGAGNDAVIAGAPVWEGGPASTDLDFSATGGQSINVPSALNATKTWQFAIYNPVFAPNVGLNAPAYQNFANNPSLLCGTTNQQLCLIENSMISFKSQRFYALSDNTESAETMPPGWNVLTLVCGSNVNGVVTKTRMLYDGAEVGGYITQGDANTCPNPGTAAGAGNYQIGGSPLLNGTWWTGKIAAAWAWKTQLTLSEATAAAASGLAYLHAKGAPTEYRATPAATPLIVAGLDSRTAGVNVTPATVWPAAMQLTDASYARVNLAIPGNAVFDACAAFDLTYGLEIASNAEPVILMLWGGVNDYGRRTPRQIADDLRCMVLGAKKRGARVVLATEISNYNSATNDGYKDQLDTILRAEAFGWGVDNLADLATDPHIGPDGASANASCFPDTLHPGPNCEPYVTAIMQNAANELLGASEGNRTQVSAATYQEVAGDRYLDLTGTSAQTLSLPDCVGYSLKREVTNVGAVAASVAAVNGETLTGAGTIAVGARAVFQPIPGAPAVGGCRWERTQ